MVLSGQGKAGNAKFMGNIDLQSGAVMGMWQFTGSQAGQGTFSGNKK